MSGSIGTNIRAERERKSRTQEHLAQAAGISARTLQRAETGRGLINAETLLAIAGALEVTIDDLRQDHHAEVARILGVAPADLTSELLQARMAEFEASHRTFPLTVVKVSGDIAPAFGGDALHFSCGVAGDDVADVAAQLREYLGDMMDLRGDMNPTGVREHEKEIFKIIRRLNELGCAVSVGVDRHPVVLRNGESMPSWTTSYVVASPATAPRTLAIISKDAEIDLGF